MGDDPDFLAFLICWEGGGEVRLAPDSQKASAGLPPFLLGSEATEPFQIQRCPMLREGLDQRVGSPPPCTRVHCGFFQEGDL